MTFIAKSFGVAAIVATSALCAFGAQAEPEQNDGLNGTLWLQTSVEYKTIGRKVATDLACALGTQRKREKQIVLLGGFLNGLQDRTGFNGGGKITLVNLDHAVHALKVDQDLFTIGNRTAAPPGIATLWHNRDVMCGTNGNRLGDFLGTGRKQDDLGMAFKLAACLCIVGGQNVAFHAETFGAQQVL